MVFASYAKYYDLLYRDKDYQAEIDFLLQAGGLFQPASILDLGCGTGGHILPLARLGFQVSGVDLSEVMIQQAKRKAVESGLAIDFYLGDICTVNLGKTFDTVISMFAVMGYQTGNQDFYSALQNARRHLQPGGLFIFDVWFGPAVLRERPETRVREMSAENQRVLRIASPELDLLRNVVTVQYTILRLAGDQVIDESRESHPMRFFFAPEVAFFAGQAGFEVQKLCPFMDLERTPTDRDWNVTWVLRAV